MKGGGKMKTLLVLIKRNTKIFFKDKAMFFTAMITPGILLVLYTTFLGNLYYSSFADAIPEGIGAVGLILVVLMGAMIFMVLLLFCISVAAVLFEICDLIFDKRGFAFAYGLISFGFLLFFGSALFDTVVSAITEGTIATLWQSGELYFYIALTLSALIPSLVGAKRMIKSKRS